MATAGLVKVVVVVMAAVTVVYGAYHNFCQGQTHFSGFEFGCCNGSILDSGIDFQANWKKCATPAKTDDETVPQTMWRVYACIVKEALKGKTISLRSYATAMSANYKSPLKAKIKQAVAAHGLNTEGMSPQQELNAIRVTYHNIERGICEGSEEEISLERLTSCSSPSDIIRENAHSRGDCCLEEQIPIRLTYLRREPSESSQDCTLDFMKKGGELSKYEFRGGKYDKTAFFQTYGGTFYNSSDAQQMCLQTCIVMVDLEIETKFSPLPFNFTLFMNQTTGIFSKTVKAQIAEKFNQTDMHAEVDNTVYYVLPQIIQSEFNRQSNHSYLNMILKTCESHNLSVRKIESALFEACRK